MSAVAARHTFRRMQVADLADVMRNERRSYTHPWTQGIFNDCIRSGYECWLIELDGRVVGHGVLSVSVGDGHVLNVCVEPHHQGEGLGRALVVHLLAAAHGLGAERVFLEVRPSNLIAYKLYESLGFNEVGVRRDYYPAFVGREDALVLAREMFSDETFGPGA